MTVRSPRVVHTINFRILPLPGTVLMYEGQRYVAVGSRLHRKADGAEVPLILWRSHCATCGAPFECGTALKALNPNRRCPAHHKPGLAVTRLGRAIQKKFAGSKRPQKPASASGRPRAPQ